MAKSLTAEEGLRDVQRSIARAQARKRAAQIAAVNSAFSSLGPVMTRFSEDVQETADEMSRALNRMGKNITDWDEAWTRKSKIEETDD